MELCISFLLRFCVMTSLGLFHLCADGFQADVLLCLCLCPLILSVWRKQRKGCSESYTSASLTTSWVHLKMRSDDTRAPGAPLSLPLSLPHSSLSFPPWHTFTLTVACFEGRNLLPDSHSARALHCDVKKGRETLLLALKEMSCWSCIYVEWQSNSPYCIPDAHKSNRGKKMSNCSSSVSLSCAPFRILI